MRPTEFISASDCLFSGPGQQGIEKKRHSVFKKRSFQPAIGGQGRFLPRKYPHAATLQGTISGKSLLLSGCTVADRGFLPRSDQLCRKGCGRALTGNISFLVKKPERNPREIGTICKETYSRRGEVVDLYRVSPGLYFRHHHLRGIHPLLDFPDHGKFCLRGRPGRYGLAPGSF